MVFSCLEYLLVFLPVTLLGFVLASNRSRLALGWLVLCSLFFYAWWEPSYLLLLPGSMIFNFVLAGWMSRQPRLSGKLLAVGVTTNLAAINKWMLQRMIARDPRFAVSADTVVAKGNELWDLIVEYYPTSTCTDIPETCGVFDPALHDPPATTN